MSAIDMAKLKLIIPRISSKAVTPMMVDVTCPLALDWWTTAKVADGSVGEAREANKSERGI